MTITLSRRSGTGATLDIELSDGGGGDPWDAVVVVEWVPGLASASGPRPEDGVINNAQGFVLWRDVKPGQNGTKTVQVKFRLQDKLEALRVKLTVYDVINKSDFSIPFAITP
ncbi:MAG: hypothetical protein AAGB93_05090 [Planctomycetota bacterium]